MTRAAGERIDEAELRRLVEGGMKSRDVAERMGWGRNTVIRAAKRLGLEWSKKTRGPSQYRAAQVPNDFDRVGAGKSVAQVCAHYGCGVGVASAWLRSSGVERYRAKSSTPKPAKPKKPKASLSAMGQAKQTLFIDVREDTPASRAADVMRGERWIVYRCNDVGAASQGGKLWRLGRLVVTDAEMIERAERVSMRRAA